VSSTGPTARFYASAATLNGNVVLFGGADGSGGLSGETWLWNGAGWTQATVSGPQARCGAAMAGP
jgi:hypothetical protein